MPTPPRTVVIVEDDESLRQAMHRMLAVADFDPEAFASPEAALASPRSAEAACLVLDVQLPGLSGFELFDCLVAAGTRPTVIFITAFDGPIPRKRAAERNAAAFLTKPFRGTELVAAVRRAIANAQHGPGGTS
jgi:FixJ family two-component response regulator